MGNSHGSGLCISIVLLTSKDPLFSFVVQCFLPEAKQKKPLFQFTYDALKYPFVNENQSSLL